MNSSASVIDSEDIDELSRLMVPVLPAKVVIQVTGAPKLFDADEPTPEWLLHDLRLAVCSRVQSTRISGRNVVAAEAIGILANHDNAHCISLKILHPLPYSLFCS